MGKLTLLTTKDPLALADILAIVDLDATAVTKKATIQAILDALLLYTTPGTAEASKPIVLDANKDILDIRKLRLTTGLLFGTDTLDANTLDGYEEGTWTPVFPANTLTGSLYGYYTKIGDMVTVWYSLDLLDYDESGNTAITVSGLPFVLANDVDMYFDAGGYFNINISGTGKIYWQLNKNNTVLSLKESVDNGNSVNIDESQFSIAAGSYLRGCISYRV